MIFGSSSSSMVVPRSYPMNSFWAVINPPLVFVLTQSRFVLSE